jgi:hypothetical protein
VRSGGVCVSKPASGMESGVKRSVLCWSVLHKHGFSRR